MQANAEFWIMWTDEHWRWQVVNDRNEVTSQGVADTMQEAYEAARSAAGRDLSSEQIPIGIAAGTVPTHVSSGPLGAMESLMHDFGFAVAVSSVAVSALAILWFF
jgi:hypothetical protein